MFMTYTRMGPTDTECPECGSKIPIGNQARISPTMLDSATVTPSRIAVPYEPRKVIFREKDQDVDPVTAT